MKCFSASGQLGYGIPLEAFRRGVEQKPDFIGCDMGSIDPGPYYLGSGATAASPIGIKRDLALVVQAGMDLGVPLLIGSAGTAGGKPHVETSERLLREVAAELGLRFDMAVIDAEVPVDVAAAKLRAGKVSAFGDSLPLTEQTLRESVRIVAQMGIEPYQQALAKGAQVVLAGRSCDTSIFAAIPVANGFPMGLSMHMAKLIECVSLCAEPGGRDSVMATLHRDHFTVESMNPALRCTPVSIAAHALYEQSDPYRIYGPGGYVDLSACRYGSETPVVARAENSRWVELPYTVKLEGVRRAGHRYFCMGGVSDPIMIAEIEDVERGVRDIVARLLPASVRPDGYSLRMLVYGGGRGVPIVAPGARRGERLPDEIFVLVDVVAQTAEQARLVAALAKQNLLHYFYPGIKATGGNLAIPFAPDIHDGGEVFEFSVYHVMEVDDPLELFPIRYARVE